MNYRRDTNYGMRPLKRWGQNFLQDKNIAEKIIASACLHRQDTVLEIGSGTGVLTREIAGKVKRVVAVEIDKKLCSYLNSELGSSEALEIICDDFIKLDINKLNLPAGTKIIGNLPYYITSPIIVKILKSRDIISTAVIMVQKEFAGRMLSSPGGRKYGSLTIFINYFADIELVGHVSKKVFYPQPEVDSSIIKLSLPKACRVSLKDEAVFFKVVRGAFLKRRKTLANSLSSSLNMNKALITNLLEDIEIEPGRRPETLSIEEFALLSDSITTIIAH